jgi:hypothetical protein
MHALFADYLEMISDQKAQCMGNRLPLNSGDSTRLLASVYYYSVLITDFGGLGAHTPGVNHGLAAEFKRGSCTKLD